MQTLPAERSLAERVTDQPLLGRIGADFGAAFDTAREVDWLKVGALGTGIVVGSALLDT